MACGCSDNACSCVIQGTEGGIVVSGTGTADDPYILAPPADVEVEFAATNSDNTVEITPGGTDGHTPEINTMLSDDAGNIIEKHADGLFVGATSAVIASRFIGELIETTGNSTPALCLEADGNQYDVVTYPDLAAEYGATGSGDGIWDVHPQLGAPTAGKFRTPDVGRRQTVGRQTQGNVADAIGLTDAVAFASRSNAHTHTGPAHVHAAGTLAGASASISTTQSGTNDATQTGVLAGLDTTEKNAIMDAASLSHGAATTETVAADGHHHDISHTHTDSISGSTGSAGTGATGSATLPYAVVRKVVFAGA